VLDRCKSLVTLVTDKEGVIERGSDTDRRCPSNPYDHPPSAIAREEKDLGSDDIELRRTSDGARVEKSLKSTSETLAELSCECVGVAKTSSRPTTVGVPGGVSNTFSDSCMLVVSEVKSRDRAGTTEPRCGTTEEANECLRYSSSTVSRLRRNRFSIVGRAVSCQLTPEVRDEVLFA